MKTTVLITLLALGLAIFHVRGRQAYRIYLPDLFSHLAPPGQLIDGTVGPRPPISANAEREGVILFLCVTGQVVCAVGLVLQVVVHHRKRKKQAAEHPHGR